MVSMKKFLIAAFSLVLFMSIQMSAGTLAFAAQMPKPLLVRVEAGWCPACHATQPTFNRVKARYAGKVQIIVLDVTNAKTAARAQATATRLGILAFYDKNRTQTSTVAIIDPVSHAVIGSLYDDSNFADYVHLIDPVIHSH